MAQKQIEGGGEGEFHMRNAEADKARQQQQAAHNARILQQIQQQSLQTFQAMQQNLHRMQPPPQNSPTRTFLEELRSIVKDIAKELDRLLGPSTPPPNEFQRH